MNNKIDRIYTYKNPFELDKMSIWNDICKYPHLCVSQTLVEGLKEYYKREKFSVLCTVDLFLKKLFKDWHDSSENNINQSIIISNILDKWSDKNIYSNELINSIKHNKKDVIKAIRYLIESDVDISKINNNSLSEEQNILFNLYKSVQDRKEFKTINIKTNQLKEYIDECYTHVLRDELLKYIKDNEARKNIRNDDTLIQYVNEELNKIKKSINKLNTKVKSDNGIGEGKFEKYHKMAIKKYEDLKSIRDTFDMYRNNKNLGMANTSKVYLHGIHQFSPLILRMINLLKEANIEVIAIFNYINEYSEVYKTWESVYEWTNVKFIQEGELFKDKRYIGESLGDVYENKLSKIRKNYNIKYHCFDNLTSFSDYVSVEYEKAENEYENLHKSNMSFTNEKLIKIALMNEQFYAINGEEINELLKIYFPEQFSSRHFLTYPIGQFILSLYNMWDDNENEIKIQDEYLGQALSLNIWEKDGMPTPSEMFNNLKYYFRNVTSFDDYMDNFKKLKDVSVKGNNSNRRRLSFFIYSEKELNYFRSILESIKNITENIFSNKKDNIKINFKKLISDIENLVMNPTADNKISQEEFDMIRDIQCKLEKIEDSNETTYIKNIKDTIGYYLESSTSQIYEAEWIVRDFEQIDGGVLLAAAQKRDNGENNAEKKFHYAGLSDENLLGRARKELPWPLTTQLYMELDNDIAEICSRSRNEYDNFLRYSLFYGTYFLTENKSIVLSYIKKLGDDETHPYSILNNVMNITAKDYNDDIECNEEYKCIEYEDESNIEIDSNISDSEKRSMETCFFRYLWNHCLDKDTFFFEEWQLNQIAKYFIQYSYLNKHKEFSENYFDNYKKYLPIFDEIDYKEIIYLIENKNGINDFKSYINNKMEFIYRPMSDYKESKAEVVKKFISMILNNGKKNYGNEICKNCNQKTLCPEYINNLEKENE